MGGLRVPETALPAGWQLVLGGAVSTAIPNVLEGGSSEPVLPKPELCTVSLSAAVSVHGAVHGAVRAVSGDVSDGRGARQLGRAAGRTAGAAGRTEPGGGRGR